MWELIESLVEFSRIGRKSIKLRIVDLDELLRLCLDEMRSEVEAQKAAVEIRGELGQVEADPALLKIAIHNLISNGIKYVKPGVAPRAHRPGRHGGPALRPLRRRGASLQLFAGRGIRGAVRPRRPE